MIQVFRTRRDNSRLEELAELWSITVDDADAIAALLERALGISFREVVALARASDLEFQITHIKVAP